MVYIKQDTAHGTLITMSILYYKTLTRIDEEKTINTSLTWADFNQDQVIINNHSVNLLLLNGI